MKVIKDNDFTNKTSYKDVVRMYNLYDYKDYTLIINPITLEYKILFGDKKSKAKFYDGNTFLPFISNTKHLIGDEFSYFFVNSKLYENKSIKEIYDVVKSRFKFTPKFTIITYKSKKNKQLETYILTSNKGLIKL